MKRSGWQLVSGAGVLAAMGVFTHATCHRCTEKRGVVAVVVAAALQVVFTRSATGALKMVGETFPWSEGSMFRWGGGPIWRERTG